MSTACPILYSAGSNAFVRPAVVGAFRDLGNERNGGDSEAEQRSLNAHRGEPQEMIQRSPRARQISHGM